MLKKKAIYLITALLIFSCNLEKTEDKPKKTDTDLSISNLSINNDIIRFTITNESEVDINNSYFQLNLNNTPDNVDYEYGVVGYLGLIESISSNKSLTLEVTMKDIQQFCIETEHSLGGLNAYAFLSAFCIPSEKYNDTLLDNNYTNSSTRLDITKYKVANLVLDMSEEDLKVRGYGDVDIHGEIYNNGFVTPSNASLRIYLSNDRVLDDEDCKIYGRYLSESESSYNWYRNPDITSSYTPPIFDIDKFSNYQRSFSRKLTSLNEDIYIIVEAAIPEGEEEYSTNDSIYISEYTYSKSFFPIEEFDYIANYTPSSNPPYRVYVNKGSLTDSNFEVPFAIYISEDDILSDNDVLVYYNEFYTPQSLMSLSDIEQLTYDNNVDLSQFTTDKVYFLGVIDPLEITNDPNRDNNIINNYYVSKQFMK